MRTIPKFLVTLLRRRPRLKDDRAAHLAAAGNDVCGDANQVDGKRKQKLQPHAPPVVKEAAQNPECDGGCKRHTSLMQIFFPPPEDNLS